MHSYQDEGSAGATYSDNYKAFGGSTSAEQNELLAQQEEQAKKEAEVIAREIEEKIRASMERQSTALNKTLDEIMNGRSIKKEGGE
jgi:hypothetical protein